MDAHRQVLLRDPAPRDSDAFAPIQPNRPYTPQCWPAVIQAFTDYPRVLFSVTILLALLVIMTVVNLVLLAQVKQELEALNNGKNVPNTLHCGFNGYDLTSVQNAGNLFWSDPSTRDTYSVRACGVVDSSGSCGAFAGVSQACGYIQQRESYYNFGSYGTNAGTWQSNSAGISYTLTNGVCPVGGTTATTILYFRCDQNAVQPRLSSVAHNDGPPCSYDFYINTVAMCR